MMRNACISRGGRGREKTQKKNFGFPREKVSQRQKRKGKDKSLQGVEKVVAGR